MYTMSMTVTNMQPFWHKIERCESKGCPTWRIVEWVSRLWHDTCTSGLENPKSWDFLLAFQLFHCRADHKTWWIKLIQIGFYPRSRGHATFSGRIWASFCCSKHLHWNTSCRTYAGQSSQKCVSKVGSSQQVPQVPQVPLFGYAFRGHSFPSHLLGSRSFNIAQITRSAFGRMLPVAAILLIVESARCDFPTSYIFTFWHMRTSLAFCPILHRYSATVKVSAMIA